MTDSRAYTLLSSSGAVKSGLAAFSMVVNAALSSLVLDGVGLLGYPLPAL